ncbi:hypothetical protein J7L85_03300 [candidate division WOR-3 bacterium]|nr:hypothetical protein [candidate division WOR-3 bacterium]
MLGRIRLHLIIRDRATSRLRDVDVIWYPDKSLVYVYRPEEQSYQTAKFSHKSDVIITDPVEIARIVYGYPKECLKEEGGEFYIERCHLKNATGIYRALNHKLCTAVRLTVNGVHRVVNESRSKA